MREESSKKPRYGTTLDGVRIDFAGAKKIRQGNKVIGNQENCRISYCQIKRILGYRDGISAMHGRYLQLPIVSIVKVSRGCQLIGRSYKTRGMVYIW